MLVNELLRYYSYGGNLTGKLIEQNDVIFDYRTYFSFGKFFGKDFDNIRKEFTINTPTVPIYDDVNGHSMFDDYVYLVRDTEW